VIITKNPLNNGIPIFTHERAEERANKKNDIYRHLTSNNVKQNCFINNKTKKIKSIIQFKVV
jgi:hypothetical protein